MDLLYRFYGDLTARPIRNGGSIAVYGDHLTEIALPHRQVEIYSAVNPDTGGRRDLLARFVVGAQPLGQMSEAPAAAPVFFKEDGYKAIHSALSAANGTSESFVFWIGGVENVPNRPQLEIEGLWLIEEFLSDAEGLTERRVMPVVPRTGESASGIKFGNGSYDESDPSLRVEYLAPIPTISSSRSSQAAVRAVFDSTSIAASKTGGRDLTNLYVDGRNIDFAGEPSILYLTLSQAAIEGALRARNWSGETYLEDFVTALGIKETGNRGGLTLEIHSAEGGGVRVGDAKLIGAASVTFTCAPLDMTDALGLKIDPGSEVTLSVVWETDWSGAATLAALDAGEEDPPEARGCNVLVALTWSQEIVIGETSPPLDGFVSTQVGLDEVARLSRKARAALPAVVRQPQTALPDLQRTRDDAAWFAAYAVGLTCEARGGWPLVDVPARRGDAGFALTRHSDLPAPMQGFVTIPARDDKLTVWMKLDRLFEQGVAAWRKVALSFHRDTFQDAWTVSRAAIRFGLVDAGTEIEAPGSFRIGAFAFRGGRRLLSDTDRSEIVLTRRDGDPAMPRQPNPTSRLRVRLDLEVSWIDPITTDIARGDRDDRPDDILIRERAPPADASAEYALLLTEALADDQDRHLTGDLRELAVEDAGGGDSGGVDGRRESFVVLMRKPLAAVRVYPDPWRSRDAAAGEVLAAYDSDDQVWRRSSPGDTYTYVRPASGIGEGADKPRRYEIFDPDEIGAAPAKLTEAGEVEEQYAVPMRLTPPTVLWTRPSDLERNLVEPRFAVRNLFRQRGDFGLGMQVAGLRTELVYGLSTGLLPSPATAERPVPRIAELEAIAGRMLSPNVAKTGDGWRTLRDELSDRPEHLEIWTLDTSKPDPFVPARFEAGLSFALRSTAFAAPPVESDHVDPATAPPGYEPVRFDPHGLPGGALWPIEQANVARVLAENPEGSGGTLERIALSPFGDSGEQTARFMDGYASVITETNEGRLSRHRVEILGRIAPLWHRAKHVVIYERTTAASAQFAPEDQPWRSQRPILRKVAEFVEIMEPVRRFPDMPDATERSVGPLREVRFNATRIAVDSAWGEDIGSVGWRVPLWDRAAARRRPQVYPFPDISFVTAAEGDGDTPLAVQDCLDPDFLYFYTDPVAANETSVDTDLWPSRRGVDYTPLGDPAMLRKVLGLEPLYTEPPPPEPAKARRSPDSRIVPGLRNFTWRLAKSARRSRINAGRGTKPIFAGLDSVSFMRSPPALEDTDAEVLKGALKIRREVDDVRTSGRYPSAFGRFGHVEEAEKISEAARAIKAFEDGSSEETFNELKKKLGALTGC